jgi:hypothetical protein
MTGGRVASSTSSAPAHKPPGIARQRQLQQQQQRFIAQTHTALPVLESALLYSNDEVSRFAVFEPSASAGEDTSSMVGLQDELIFEQYGSQGRDRRVKTHAHEELPPPPPRKNELWQSIVNEDPAGAEEASAPALQATVLPRGVASESLPSASSPTSMTRLKKRSDGSSGEGDPGRSPLPLRRGRTPPPNPMSFLFDKREHQRMQLASARRSHAITRSLSMLSYDAVISHPVLQEVYEPEEMRYSRLSFLVQIKHKIQVLWFNSESIDHLNELHAAAFHRRQDVYQLNEERDEYAVEISLQALSASGGTQAEDDAAATATAHLSASSLVKKFNQSTLENNGATAGIYFETTERREKKNRASAMEGFRDGVASLTCDSFRSDRSARISRSVSSSAISTPPFHPNGNTAPCARPSSIGGGVLLSGSAEQLPVGAQIETQGSITDPLVPEELVRGLFKLRGELEQMLLHHSSNRTSAMFPPMLPPSRHLYVQSERGSGVCTLVKAMCQSHKYNFLRMHITTDLTFREDLFTTLIDYARMIQPCVVLFDRCDFWFRTETYQLRGEKFVLSHAGYPSLPSENVFFVFSCETPLPLTGDGFRDFVSYHHVVESPMQADERWKCFRDFFQVWIKNMRDNANELPTNIDQVIAEYMEGLSDYCVTLADRFQHFTPGMIKTFCERVMHTARTRASNEALPLQEHSQIQIQQAFPIEDDFSFTENLIETTTPGRIVWKVY